MTDSIALTSITSYDDFRQRQRTDGDGMNLASFDLQKSDGYIHSFNQELRIASSASGPLRWMVGGNYEKSTTYADSDEVAPRFRDDYAP
ncbi:hypothetical protein [Sphingobium sp. BS19]|uniref:hypothetical protein n=1 Tax=Sphingobium sp. BS19 TaxID=3018973 RepID=UPI0022EE45A1|nr:hypothetical protein [Sphingobium sp. BS19]GLJ00750.1 hypothetical protein Sbs19_45740 [Sphingobium sp. BS19]